MPRVSRQLNERNGIVEASMMRCSAFSFIAEDCCPELLYRRTPETAALIGGSLIYKDDLNIDQDIECKEKELR